MTIISKTYPIEIMADEGYYLTNSEIYSTYIILGKYDSVDNWHEIPIEEVPEDARLPE